MSKILKTIPTPWNSTIIGYESLFTHRGTVYLPYLRPICKKGDYGKMKGEIYYFISLDTFYDDHGNIHSVSDQDFDDIKGDIKPVSDKDKSNFDNTLSEKGYTIVNEEIVPIEYFYPKFDETNGFSPQSINIGDPIFVKYSQWNEIYQSEAECENKCIDLNRCFPNRNYPTSLDTSSSSNE